MKKSHLIYYQKYKNHHHNFFHNVFNIINRLIKYKKNCTYIIFYFILFNIIKLNGSYF